MKTLGGLKWRYCWFALLSLVFNLSGQKTCYSQISARFPVMDTLYFVSGCTPPLITLSVDTSRVGVDSVSIAGGFNTTVYVPDSGAYPRMIQCAYLLVSDSARDFSYRLYLTDLSSGISDSLQPDTAYVSKPDTFHLVLTVTCGGIPVDSALYVAIVKQIPLRVDERRNYPPSRCSLNIYPNPFNPMATIEYRISELEPVSLKIYDALGREVANLVKEVLGPGEYVIRFDGSRLASGLYFCTLKAGSDFETWKLLLLK